MTIREELEERVYRALTQHHGDKKELAELLVEDWYETRSEWVDKLVDRAQGDIELLTFLAEKYPDGDEEEDE